MTKSNQKRSELTEDQKKRKRESGKRSQQILRDRRKGINKKVEDNGGDPSILNKEELSEYNKLLSSKKRNKERRNAQKQARMASPEEDEKFKKKNAEYSRKYYWEKKREDRANAEAQSSQPLLNALPTNTTVATVAPAATNTATNPGFTIEVNSAHSETGAPITTTTGTPRGTSTRTITTRNAAGKYKKANDVVLMLIDPKKDYFFPLTSMKNTMVTYEMEFKKIIFDDLLMWGLKPEEDCFDKLLASAVEYLHDCMWPNESDKEEYQFSSPPFFEWNDKDYKGLKKYKKVSLRKQAIKNFIRKKHPEWKNYNQEHYPEEVTTSVEVTGNELSSTSETYSLRGISVGAAIEKVLDNEIANADEEYNVLVDKVHQDYGSVQGRPYYIVKDHNRLELRQPFVSRNVSQSDFHPLKRFSTKILEKEEYFRESFNNDSVSGYLFEAIVGHYIENNRVECLNCNQSYCMKWSGGSLSPWEDIKCVNCGSTYELKSKRDDATIEKELKSGFIRGGSFRGFLSLYHRQGFNSPSRYLMLVSRSPVIPNDGTRFWKQNVHVGKIMHIVPTVNEKSFGNIEERIKLKSKVQLANIQRCWLEIPMDTNYNRSQIINNVLQKGFSKRS